MKEREDEINEKELKAYLYLTNLVANVVALTANPLLAPIHIIAPALPTLGETSREIGKYVGGIAGILYGLGFAYALATGNDVTPWLAGMLGSYTLWHSSSVLERMEKESYKELV